MNGQILHRCSKQIDWKKIEGSSPEEQIEFLSGWRHKFQVELVSSDGKNLKKGDHLAIERYRILPKGSPLYSHHAICTSIKRDTVTLSEYGANISGILDVPQSGLQGLVKIQYNEYSVADLEKKMVGLLHFNFVDWSFDLFCDSMVLFSKNMRKKTKHCKCALVTGHTDKHTWPCQRQTPKNY